MGKREIIRNIEERVERAVEEIAQEILDASNDRVPVDTGKLERSGDIEYNGTRATVFYDAPYAAEVHERTELSYDNGEARFLKKGRVEIEADVENILDRYLS